ncbi:FecR family protein [Hyphococcus luteus]|nr:FecR domain-containing protein [Marinicaulis flavus]
MRIGAEADSWHARINEGPLTPDEARAFNEWLAADPEHERQYRCGQMALREVLLMRGERDLEDLMRPTVYERINSALYDAGQWLQTQSAGRIARAGFVTAAVSSILLVSFFAVQLGFGPEQMRISAPASPAEPLYETKIAEIRDVTLSDGSIVTLGAASGVDVLFTQNERRVVLSEGEAFFQVEKDPDRPFIVVADNMLVRVLGTKFDVNLGAKAVGISVLEGRVEVIRPEGDSGVMRDSDIKHVLTAGQKVAAAKQGRVQPVETVDVENVAAWRRGELVWVDTPVRDIIADLNRYSPSKIVLANSEIGDLGYTLALQADDVSRGVRLLASSLGLEAKERPNGDIVLR